MGPKRLGHTTRIHLGSVVLLTALGVASLLVLPSIALAQATAVPSPTTVAPPTPAPSPTPAPAATPTPAPQGAPSLTLSSTAGQAGASITANGNGFRSGETVTVTFNGQSVGTPTASSGGTFALSFNVPGLNPGQYAVLAVGQASGASATTSFTINQGNGTLTFSPAQADPGTQLTVTGTGFRPGEMVKVTFNAVDAGTATADTSGNITVTFRVPNIAAGAYGVTATGQTSGVTVTTSFTVTQPAANLTFSPLKAPPGVALTVTGSGFKPGETVDLTFNGPKVGSATVDTKGIFSVTFTLPTLSAGDYQATATGETSGTTVTETFTLLAAGTPAPTAGPTAAPATPAATSTPATSGGGAPASSAPAIVHDERYFSQTGYRIENDDAWAFFQSQGKVDTFGYPVSRVFSFLGCPAQMFQRQIIQNCPGQGTALINMLDPDIFPYIHVNSSTFPASDPAMKADTPAVGSPTYDADMNAFIVANVPDTFNGQPVNFLQTFNTLGGLTIWGAPNSHPAPDPNNGNFIYQRFQRAIMQYIQGQGTVSVLLADYLKAIMINQGVPPDLAAESAGSRFSNQYCPGQVLWLCRPSELGGTDLTFAFVPG